MTTIKERRFNVSLWRATDIDSDGFNPKEDLKREKLICELRSCNLNFMMGSIPTASATPILGSVINAKEGEDTAQVTIKNLLDLAENRSPVIIALKVTQSFSSENNQPDITHWKFSEDKGQDRFGQYDNDYIDIFIGYLCPFTAEITATGAGIRLTIQHWLGALANSSLLTPALTTATPMSLAIQYYTNVLNNEAIWLYKKLKLRDDPNIWRSGIKVVFLDVLEKYESWKGEETFSKKIRNRIRYAIEHIDGELLTLKEDLFVLYSPIEQELETDCRRYINTSAWNTLVGTYAPSFLFDIIPGIKKTRLIPTSCTVNTKSLVILFEKDIFRITSTTLSPVQLSQIIEVASIADNTMGGMQGANECKPIAYYPPGSKKKEGFIQTVYYPAWVANKTSEEVKDIVSIDLLYAKSGAIEDESYNVDTAQEEAAKAGETSSKFAYEFAKVNYLVQAYNRTSAHVVLPLRLDISLGTSVCCVIKSEQGASMKIYGIVTGIQISLPAPEATPVTQLTLSGIRTENLAKSDIENPQDPVGLYESRWGGKGVGLYD